MNALNTPAISDSDYKSRRMACTSPGSLHASTAFSGTRLGRSLWDCESGLARSKTRDGHCMAADEAYAASEPLAAPWPGHCRGSRWRDASKYFSSLLRIHIEQFFGIVLWRWFLCRRPLRVPFLERSGLIWAYSAQFRPVFFQRSGCAGNALREHSSRWKRVVCTKLWL